MKELSNERVLSLEEEIDKFMSILDGFISKIKK
jgi:hypothetical protein